MATFTNYATLSYSGGMVDSNTVTGQLRQTLTATKTAVRMTYTADDTVTYVVALRNEGNTPFTGLTLSDDLGGYAVNTATVYPLIYRADSVRYYQNGVLQAAPAVTAGPPMSITGITVPANGNTIVVYQAGITGYAPLALGGTVDNTVTVTGTGVTTALTAQESITAEARPLLSITKGLTPVTVTENGQLTYTFVIQNTGNTEAAAADAAVLSDTFDPILSNLSVTYNGTPWVQGTNYTYAPATGLFTTLPGQITVPAATYTQNTDGTYTITPGAATVTVTGTV